MSMFRLHKYLQAFVVIVSIVLVGCDRPKLELIKSDGVILAFGDSLTEGVGTTKQYSYPTVLGDLSGRRIINSGVSGETSEEGLRRLPSELARISPDLLILIEGGNDILQNLGHADTKENLAAMIELAKSRGVPVVLVGIPEKKLFSSSAPFYKELAEQYQLVFDGTLIGSLQRSSELKSDHVHFNKNGYRKMAESIYKLLRNNGALQ